VGRAREQVDPALSNPEEDTLVISRVWPRVAAAIDAVPDGTILLTSSVQPQTSPLILQRALGERRRVFDFQVLDSSPDRLQVVRLSITPTPVAGDELESAPRKR
jgi:hypothetical protein